MSDDDEHALEAVLRFLYTGGYSIGRWKTGTAAEDSDIYDLLLVKYLIEVCLLADKYDIPDLRKLATLAAKYATTKCLPVEEN